MHRTEGIHPALQFLNQHINLLKTIGIKKIYLEQIEGFNSNSTFPHKIHNYFFQDEPLPFPEDSVIGQICQLAKRQGMEVIGAETVEFISIEIPSRGPLIQEITTRGTSRSRRLENFNSQAASLIRTINEPFVVFVGAAHGKLRDWMVPGISDYLDCPCIGLKTNIMVPFVGEGTHQYTDSQYSVDAVFS